MSEEPTPAPVGLGSGRIEGCQSTNHSSCYGDLWQCASCGKTVCYNEGSDSDHDLCDDCWAIKHGALNKPKEDT